MARVLIAWELGEAYGHLARCLHLADGLRRCGHTVTLALKDMRLPGGPAAASGMTVLAAPMTAHLTVQRSSRQTAPINYADVLLHCGFADPHDLAARLYAWQGMFSLARADVLLADHAPTALLAAHLSGLPHLAIGNGFAIPPAVRPWPSLRPWAPESEATLTHAEARLDQATDAAQRLINRNEPVRVRELFSPRDVLDTFAELDHYGARSCGRYVGPIGKVPRSLRTAWQGQGGPRVLAYLRPGVPGLRAIVQGLARLEAEVLCVIPGLPLDTAREMATRRLRIALGPVDLPPLFQQTDLAISYGNSGFSTQALLAGVPLLMRPRHVEQALFARQVEALGAGRSLVGRLDAQTVVVAVEDLLDTSACRIAAQEFAQRYCGFTPQTAIDTTIAAIEQCSLAMQAEPSAGPAADTQKQEPAAQCFQ